MAMIRLPTLVASAALAFVAATALAQDPTITNVRIAMTQNVNPSMLAIWEITNNAMDENGGLDAAQMDEAKFDNLAYSAGRLAEAGRTMATWQSPVAAGPNNRTVSEDQVSMDHVQHQLDADPAGFRAKAVAFAEHSEKLVAAAKARDVAATGTLVSEMDAVCEACHAQYWYGE
ncbi:cytochrome c [Croceibacterium sp. LX-88]|uniref:Cytochrome c n=1 Tax=Croceibacterium selenioxidans TaxID=2838833 RepID=A0ABS5W9G7_9SPHN|nr:cytochrome c [Croceibacterium selenioxidans]MBT2135054.1 cytochrome c [Croceibacterium selenioxidans]